MTDEEKAGLLHQLLKELAATWIHNDKISQYVSQLKNIYCEKDDKGKSVKYRHEYFRISQTIYEISADESLSFEMLLYNLAGLITYIDIEEKGNDLFISSVKKLNDHINLEITRIVRAKKHDRELHVLSLSVKNALEQTKESLEKIEKLAQDTEQTLKKIEELKQDIDTSTTNQITILSIFTGIVMAFVGGFSILGSAFSNAELFEARVWLLIFLMSLVGFIFFNTVFMFIYMVAKLSGKRLSVQCKSEQCGMCMKCEECKASKVWCPFHKLWKKYPYVAYVNIVLLFMIVATGAYGFHSSFCSQRAVPANAVVEDQLSQTEQSLPSDIDFDIQLTNECTYGKADLEKGEKKNPRTGE